MLRWRRKNIFLAEEGAVWERTVPLTIHEDAGPASKVLSANQVSFSGLLSSGDEKLTKFIIFTALKNKGVVDDNAWPSLIRDLEDLARGVRLGDDMWRFVLLFGKADEEVRVNTWGLPSYNAPNEVCSECLANRTTRPFTDLSAAAAWRPTQ